MFRRAFFQLALALRQNRLDQAHAILKRAAAAHPGFTASALIRQANQRETRWVTGPVRSPDPIYLLASITKPITATAVMLLADRGELKLDDPVQRFIPEFQGAGRERVLIRHLLSHTSGLPDMLPDNDRLRERHAPLAAFIAGTCRVPLAFAPGTRCQYQSMGILLAAEIAVRLTRQPLSEFLATHVFAPLGMKHASLGLGGRPLDRTEQCQVTGNPSWNWNSPYWRNLGSPWGGAHATASDVMRFLEAFQGEGGILKPATARAMITNQNAGLNQPWGLGWLTGPGRFPSPCSHRTYGHSGSTGTLCWADPASGLRFVLLTNRPAELSRAAILNPAAAAVAGTDPVH